MALAYDTDTQFVAVALRSRSQDAMRFTNHSCSPNARIQVEDGEISFFALLDLGAGDEITVDYGLTHHEGRLACRCRAPGCRGSL